MTEALNDNVLHSFMETFYGYGSYSADYWFVGMEEGGGNSWEEIHRRVMTWQRRGCSELEDVASYHVEIDIPHLFGEHPKLQSTWSKLIRIVLSARGEEVTTEKVRQYQGQRLGRPDGDTCLLELLPLPSPSTGRWLYGEYSAIPFLKERETYRKHLAERRLGHIRQRISVHRPRAVVFYSISQTYQMWWRQIARGVEFQEREFKGHRLYVGNTVATTFVITTHPVSKGVTNDYFHKVGDLITGCRNQLGK